MGLKVEINQLVKSLLQKESLEQCSLQELEQFAGRHPYFGAAQLLLAKKMQVEQADGYQDQLQKTYLFFNNPLWVQQLLGETGGAVIEAALVAEVSEPAAGDAPVISEDSIQTEELIATKEELVVEKEEPVISEPVLQKEEAVTSNQNTDLVFEPFHTVDYFASQGIKLKLEDKPLDKFGQQLKSFTDWLKTMKRLPVTEIAAGTEPATENKVVQMAEHSLEEKEVLTEAMADVWIKQGNRDKARDIYHKLSLLEPSKSAYFAAKIEDLQK